MGSTNNKKPQRQHTKVLCSKRLFSIDGQRGTAGVQDDS